MRVPFFPDCELPTVRRAFTVAWLAAAAFLAAGMAQAQTVTTLANFASLTSSPYTPGPSGLIADANGNLYGTTQYGGAFDLGTVFQIVKTAGGYDGTPIVLATFDGSNGAYPIGGLIIDASGNLYGTATLGGGGYVDGEVFGDGTVFEIARTAGGYASTPIVLATFNGTNGYQPYGNLLADANGNLYGATAFGGDFGKGTVFQIAWTAGGYASTPIVLASFNGTNGYEPNGGLIADAGGNLYGTTYAGGDSGYGTVFQIARTAGGYSSTPIVLASFNKTNGGRPVAGLIADASGNLLGTTTIGGAYSTITRNGGGVVFEIAKTAGGYASTPIVLTSFPLPGYPAGGLIADANGNLYGTTTESGASVFEIARTASGYAGTPTVLASFHEPNGVFVWAGLFADANGNL